MESLQLIEIIIITQIFKDGQDYYNYDLWSIKNWCRLHIYAENVNQHICLKFSRSIQSIFR